MTSKEIRNHIESNQRCAQESPLWELVYQFAVLNETLSAASKQQPPAPTADSASESEKPTPSDGPNKKENRT